MKQKPRQLGAAGAARSHTILTHILPRAAAGGIVPISAVPRAPVRDPTWRRMLMWLTRLETKAPIHVGGRVLMLPILNCETPHAAAGGAKPRMQGAPARCRGRPGRRTRRGRSMGNCVARNSAVKAGMIRWQLKLGLDRCPHPREMWPPPRWRSRPAFPSPEEFTNLNAADFGAAVVRAEIRIALLGTPVCRIRGGLEKRKSLCVSLRPKPIYAARSLKPFIDFGFAL